MNIKQGLAVAGIVGVLGTVSINAVAPKEVSNEQRRQEITRQYQHDLAQARKIEDDRRRAQVVDAIHARTAEQLQQVEVRPREHHKWLVKP